MRRLGGLLLATLLAVAACGPTSPASSTPGPTDAVPSASSSSATPSAAATLSAGLACGEIHLLPAGQPDRCEQLDGFWGPILGLAAVPGSRAYFPPASIMPYRAGDVPDTACTIGDPPERWVNGAFYCPNDDRIVFDEGWFRRAEAAFGRFAPVAVLAHEWGHHVQEVLGIRAKSIRIELQADCLAGMFLASTIPLDQSGGPMIGDAELLDGLATFFDLADEAYVGSGWFAPSEHGSAVQRMLAYSTGILGFGTANLPVSQGLSWCLGYRAFGKADFATVGPYRLVQFPGRPGTIDGESYVVPPDTSTAISSSTIILRWMPDFVGGATPANVDLVLEGFEASAWLPDYLDLSGNLGIGSGIARYYVKAVADDEGTARDQVGIIGLIAPASGIGAMLILVTRPEGLPRDTSQPALLAVVEEEVLSLYQVINRLCTPDHSGDPGAENLSTVCMEDQ